ncbi:MAG: tetratricopeptide repeat protein [Thermoanaerobaculales bacterium]|nr:tetratricopeptide repeat protein [Thermoanaerobaculales bacterium]
MRFRIVILFFVIGLAAFQLFPQGTTPSEEAAIQAYRQGAFSRAVDLYTQALSETTDSEHRARLHVNVGWTLFALGRTDEVNTHLRAALVENPGLTLIPDYYTQEFLDLFDAARRQIVDGVNENNVPAPDLEATLEIIEDRVANDGDLEAALADVDRLIEFYPLDGRLIPIKVQVLTMLGRTADAQDLARGRTDALVGFGALSSSMSIPDLILRANGQLERGDSEAALELLREAVDRQPGNVAALELMAEAAQRSERWQEAEFALKTALGFQSENLGLSLRLGEVYLAKGDASAARDIFRRLTGEFPRSDRAWAALGLLDANLGNRDHAEAELKTALQENPLLPEVQLAYGELLLARGDATQALAAFRSASNLLQQDPHLEGRIGQALLALGEPEAALESLRTAVENGFSEADVQRSMALALIQTGSLAEGERTIDAVGPGAQHDGKIVSALLQLERDNPVEALATLEPIASKRPGEPLILNLLAVSLYRLDRFEDAASVLTQAYETGSDNEIIERNLGHANAAVAAGILEDSARSVRALELR